MEVEVDLVRLLVDADRAAVVAHWPMVIISQLQQELHIL
jgi:hypothetical protein